MTNYESITHSARYRSKKRGRQYINVAAALASRVVSKTMLRLVHRFSETSPNYHADDNPIAADELKLK
jgi:hypothetical protein